MFSFQLKKLSIFNFDFFAQRSKMVKGQLLYKNGDSYFGQLKAGGQLCGQGVYKFSNGSVYEGAFQQGQFHGRGKLIDHFNSITIISNFQKGKANGQGKIIYQDQSLYQGQILQGLRDGKGRYIYATKQLQLQYNGQFRNDQYEGQGSLQFKNGDLCKGEFKGSLLNAMGEFKTQDFHIIGEFKNSLPHGKAKVIYSTGDSYQGEFYEGKKEGFGVYTYKDGSVYKGNFTNDFRQGSGQIAYSNGEIFKGKFRQDEPIEGGFSKQSWLINGDLKNNEFNGYCTIKGNKTSISVDYSEGRKNGFLTMVKINPAGQQVTFKSQFRKDKQNPLSVSYSQRF